MSTIAFADRRPAPPNRATARSLPRGHVRLTRRGRLVVFLGALVLLLLAAFFLGSGSVATERSGAGEPTRVVVVAPGDTLWAIADRAAGDGSTREMITRIQRLNALESAGLEAGQRIRVPAAR